MAHMKQLKIRPKGGRVAMPLAVRADLRAGDQKKTKRYMEPSKIVVAAARARMRLSKNVFRRLWRFVGGPGFSWSWSRTGLA